MSKIGEFAMHFLVNAGWEIAVVAIGASICARLLRNAAPRYRHALWVACFVLCVALPLWGLLDLQTAGRPHPVKDRTAAFQETGRLAATPDPSPGLPVNAMADAGRLTLDRLLQKRSQAVAAPPALALTLAIAYALFLLYRLGALRRAWLQARRLKSSACERELPTLLASVAERCRDAFGLKRISLAFSAQTTTPVTIGALQPVIILPESFYEETSEEMLATVLGHEMAHVARRDFALNLVYEFLRLPVSFHPIANLMKRQIARTRELACDDMVTERLLAPEAYARSLLRAAGALIVTPGQALTLGVFDADILEERIMKLTRNTRRPGKRATRLLTICALLLLCVTCVVISTFSFDLRANRESERSKVAAGESLVQVVVKVQELSEQSEQKRTALDISELAQKLNSAGAQDRAEAACSAGKSRAIEVIPMLMAMLGDDTRIKLIKCWEGGRWSPALDTFNHASPGEQAAIALASMGTPALDPLTRALDDANPSVRRNAAWAIGELPHNIVEIRAEPFDPREKQRAKAVPPLVKLLDDSDEWVRMAAAQALGEIRDERAVKGLIAELSDRTWQPRKAAAWALGEMKEQRAVEALCNLLLSDEQSEVRLTATWALGEIQDERAVEALCDVLTSDAQSEVRRTAAWALGEIQSSRAVPFLKRALSDPDDRVRAKAAWALSEIEDSDG
jgi:HEAT repeat protein/beta-lactamase regulating signal transducer with metallopeptidase domain